MAKITRDDVLKLARLSKLELSEDEIDQFTEEISEILNYADMIQKADVSNIEPTSQVTGLTNVMRKDEAIDYSVSTEDLMKNVPAKQGKLIKVKRVL